MKRTLALVATALLLSAGAAIAQTKDDGAATPGNNKAGPKVQDGSGLSGESNTVAPAGTPQNSSSSVTPATKSPAPNSATTGSGSGTSSGAGTSK